MRPFTRARAPARSVACRAACPRRGERHVFARLAQQTVGCTAALALTAGVAHANVDKLGDFAASGFIFKDTVDVIVVEDPEVSNVVLYISEMQRSLSDKLAKNFFNDPSQASLACVVTGPPRIDDVNKIRSKDGKELVSQGRNLSFFQQKALRVRRLYDEKRSAVVYVAYSTRLTSAQDEGGASTGRYKTSVCAVPIPDPATLEANAAGEARQLEMAR